MELPHHSVEFVFEVVSRFFNSMIVISEFSTHAIVITFVADDQHA